MKFRHRVAALLGVLALATSAFVFSTTTGTNRAQQALLELFCDACGQPTNTNLRDVIASTVTLSDTQTITGGKTFSGATTFSGTINGTSLLAPVTQAFRTAIPLIIAPTGTMANNGAITLGTALDATYANAYILLPAGAVAAGVPAATSWLFVQMSSTTVGQVFNNTYISGIPTVPASPTAFSTTGPGAYTGVIIETAGPTMSPSLAAGAMGASGRINFVAHGAYNNSATGKLFRAYLNGTSGVTFVANTASTTTFSIYEGEVENLSAAVQTSWGRIINSSAVSVVSEGSAGAINTANAITPTITLVHGTATDFFVLKGFRFVLYSNGS